MYIMYWVPLVRRWRRIEPQVIKTALEGFKSVPGRFELVNAGQPFSIIVDYAHTPDGLENILKTAKQIAKRRILVAIRLRQRPGPDQTAYYGRAGRGIWRCGRLPHRIIRDRDPTVILEN